LLLTGFTLIWGLKSTVTFDIHSTPSSHIRSYIAFRLIIPWLFFIGGSIWIYLSLKRCAVISIKTNRKNYKIALKEFETNNTLSDLKDFLSVRVELNNEK